MQHRALSRKSAQKSNATNQLDDSKTKARFVRARFCVLAFFIKILYILLMKKSRGKKSQSYTAVVEKDEKSGYWAYVPALPGCHTQGETLDEVYANLQEATELYLEVLKDKKESAPHSNFLSTVQVRVSA